MRAVKCKVISPGAWPEFPKQHPCVDQFAAIAWIQEQGWDHIMEGECTLLKCQTAKQFVLDEKVWINNKRKPVINYKKLYGSYYPHPINAKPYESPVKPEEPSDETEVVQTSAVI